MAALNPADDLVTKIASLSPYSGVTLARDVNLFFGPVREVRAEVPAQAVFCVNARGLKPEPYLNNQDDFKVFQVEVTVRSAPADYTGGEQLARDIMGQLQRKAPAGYITCLLQQSGPELRSEDAERQFQWAFVAELWRVV